MRVSLLSRADDEKRTPSPAKISGGKMYHVQKYGKSESKENKPPQKVDNTKKAD